ncbi:MAG TPA: large conductance mechanosensitive channel protein MscL [Longimicrobiales bacterium]|nr:large conductance mechanosensitive channel protein MscL [Longimicrobiales bacterium]
MLTEFKKFIAKGSVIDLAVAVVIGAAFAKIVDSLVKDVIMPPIGLLLSGVDFSNLFISLDGRDYDSLALAQAAGAATINYGRFINELIGFIIVAFAIFIVVKQVNRFRKPAAPTEKPCPFCTLAVPLAASRCPHCTSALQAS